MEQDRLPFASYPTVQKYAAGLADLAPAERQARLTVLEGFCRMVQRTPDQMVDEIYDVVTHKYKKRNFYMARIKEFAEQVPGTWHQQAARGNVIRSFFIANGVRVMPEKPPWL